MILTRFIAVAVCVLGVTSAQAGILFDLIDYTAGTDKLQDESGSRVLDKGAGNAGSLGVGDVIQGVFAIPSVNNQNVAFNTGGTLLGVFALEIKSTSVVGASTVFDLGAPSSAGDTISKMLSDNSISTAGLTSYSSTLGVSDATFAVLSLPTAGSLFPAGIDGSLPDLGLTSSYSVELLGGFEGDDFYQISVPTALLPAPVGLPGEEDPTSFANFRTAFTIIAADNPFPINFLELSTTEFDGSAAKGDVIGSGTISAPVNGITPTGFGFGDDGTFTMNVVPEAGSLFVWAGLGGLVGVIRTRRRS